ncbi:helix-turn-helix transcriptional regulator [archaeon]|nr:helix-turn-helix transcriptional regulator [archaeon]MBL7056866.1 helix-turn-helix transcriptional regulator [Candidatus Woesearchaeota archaeon]
MKPECTIYEVADFIGKKWTLLILQELYKGTSNKRFSELKRSIPGITPKLLSSRLKELEKLDIVQKNIDTSAFPITCQYILTDKGLAFISVIKSMKIWALKWHGNNETCKKTNCKYCAF